MDDEGRVIVVSKVYAIEDLFSFFHELLVAVLGVR